MKKTLLIFVVFAFLFSEIAIAKTKSSDADSETRKVSKSTWELLKQNPKPQYARSKKTVLKKGQRKSAAKSMKNREMGPNGEEVCECGLYAETATTADGSTMEICHNFGAHYCSNCACW